MIVKKLTKHFGTVTAVDAVSFSIDTPQMVGVIGPSGAGKSTML
ncbi:MAG: ATP-binding cassette domain-containing protein, partial [Desulfobacterales bacterium]